MLGCVEPSIWRASRAAQHNPVMKTFYERLRAAGKPMKVPRCVAARKLLHLCPGYLLFRMI
jgi:hypothetical protein